MIGKYVRIKREANVYSSVAVRAKGLRTIGLVIPAECSSSCVRVKFPDGSSTLDIDVNDLELASPRIQLISKKRV